LNRRSLRGPDEGELHTGIFHSRPVNVILELRNVDTSGSCGSRLDQVRTRRRQSVDSFVLATGMSGTWMRVALVAELLTSLSGGGIIRLQRALRIA
jgi:hypothetical protein